MHPTPTQDHGRVLLSWMIPEFEKHDRSFGWHVLAVLAGLALLVIAVLTQNYLFAVIIVLAAVLVYRQSTRHPGSLPFAIMEDAVNIGNQSLYEFKELKNFWIIYEPPKVKKLFFSFRSGFRPDLIIPLQDQNPLQIRRALAPYLPEDLEREGEPVSEALGRNLKI